jgi:hypothetical protein
MGFVAGSVRECSIDSRIYQSPADTQAKIMTGSDQNEVIKLGSGGSMLSKTPTPSGVEGLVVAIDNDNDDLAHLTGIQNGSKFVPFTITLMDNNTYSGSVQITDPIAYDTQKGTVELKLGGDGPIEKQ